MCPLLVLCVEKWFFGNTLTFSVQTTNLNLTRCNTTTIYIRYYKYWTLWKINPILAKNLEKVKYILQIHNSNEFHKICVNKRFCGSFTLKKAVTSIKKGFGGPEIKNSKNTIERCLFRTKRKRKLTDKTCRLPFSPRKMFFLVTYRLITLD